jgi:hypothetical protein
MNRRKTSKHLPNGDGSLLERRAGKSQELEDID